MLKLSRLSVQEKGQLLVIVLDVAVEEPKKTTEFRAWLTLSEAAEKDAGMFPFFSSSVFHEVSS